MSAAGFVRWAIILLDSPAFSDDACGAEHQPEDRDGDTLSSDTSTTSSAANKDLRWGRVELKRENTARNIG